MKQYICAASFNVGGGAATRYLPLAGNGCTSLGWLSADFGESMAQQPWSAAGTLSLFSLRVPTALGSSSVWTLRKNGADTAITVTLGAAATTATDVTHTVSVVVGDLLNWKYVGPSLGIGNAWAALAIQFEGSTTKQSGYAIAAYAGSVSSNPAASNALYGGAFGNGAFQTGTAASLSTLLSNTYSIASVAGSITRLDANALSGAPGAGVWTISLRKNGITQDGSGGTVNTSFTITAAATTGNKSFTLPIVAGDHVDVLIVRTVADAAFAIAQVAVGVQFTATTDGDFVMCGGNNNAVSASLTTYHWPSSEQALTTEARARGIVGSASFYVTALRVEHGPPGAAKSWTHTFRVDGVATALAVTIANLATSGSDTGNVILPIDGELSLQCVPTGTPSTSQLHWSFGATSGAVPIPPVPSGATFLTRRVRRFPHASEKQIWLFWDRLQIDIQAGTALATGQGSDPQIMLRWSDDGGSTWSHEHWQSAGVLGNRTKRAIWRKMGRSRDRVFEMVVTDPVKWIFLQALALIREGGS